MSSPLDWPLDLQLPPPALALGGLGDQAGRSGEGFRQSVSIAAKLGFRAIQIDGTAPGLRARDLDRSARRDVAATMRRAELACAGLDLLIPAWHYTDPARAERAVEAMVGAIDLAADLSTLANSGVVSRSASEAVPMVTATLPNPLPDDLKSLVESRCDSRRVRICDLCDSIEAIGTSVSGQPHAQDSPIGVSLDVLGAWIGIGRAPGSDGTSPASKRLLVGAEAFRASVDSPADRLAGVIAGLGGRLGAARWVAARLSTARMDAESIETLRYALLTLGGPEGSGRRVRVVIDPTSTADPMSAARAGLAVWQTPSAS